MAKIRKLAGFKRKIPSPVVWGLLPTGQVTFYGINVKEMVTTADGPMMLSEIKLRMEFADPNVDIATLVATVRSVRKSGALDPIQPELWRLRFRTQKISLNRLAPVSKQLQRPPSDYGMYR